jgi:Ca2+-binding RTX toxin-like protein
VLKAGGGPSVLVGGKGHNVLLGGTGIDILIGGAGKDTIKAGSGETILIGGTTTFDANIEALNALESEWSRTDETFAQKMANLSGNATGGKNGAFVLDATTVFDDGISDLLKGGNGQDWFFAHLTGHKKDRLVHVKNGDQVTSI